MLKFIKENVEIMCVRPRTKSELEEIEKKQEINEKIIKSAESITEYECSSCFIPILSKDEYKKAKIKDNLFGFCSEECYNHWLRMPRLFTKINKNDLMLITNKNIDGL
tara:strand:- start:1398 stop:1721 length:324 start_codon:yes stop_codon:yes gene_type:complete